MVSSRLPSFLAGLFGSRSQAPSIEGAWGRFVARLCPPYGPDLVLEAALDALAEIVDADGYYAYLAPNPGGRAALRTTRTPSGTPVVGPDYAGLVTGSAPRDVPLEVPAPSALDGVARIDGRAGQRFLSLAVGEQVVLRAALPPAGDPGLPALSGPCLALVERIRPTVTAICYPASPAAAGPPPASGDPAPDAAAIAERLLHAVCRVATEAFEASDAYLAVWSRATSAEQEIIWTTGDGDGLARACPPPGLASQVGPSAVAGWQAPDLPGDLAELGYGGFVFIPVGAGEGKSGALALGTPGPVGSGTRMLATRMARTLSVTLTDQAMAARLAETRLEALLVATDLFESCDPASEGHSARVAQVAEDIARALGLVPSDRAAARLAGRLHDVGMVAVGFNLAQRRRALDESEREWLRRHPVLGTELLSALPLSTVPLEVRLAVRHHHERWDGDGYPDGLAGKAIPELARIVGCAEVLVARSSPRPYRPALDAAATLRLLRAGAGHDFDPEVAEAAAEVFARETSAPGQGGVHPGTAPQA